MEGFKKKKDKKLLKQYLITYIIVLIIPLIICSSYYIRVLSVISADDMQAKQEELHHSVVRINTLMDEVASLAESLAGQTDVNLFRFQKNVIAYPNTYEVIDLQKKLLNVKNINRSVFSYYIFFDKSQLVVNDEIVYDYKDFYDLYLRREKDTSYEDWQNFLSEDNMNRGMYPEETYLYQGEKKRELLCYSKALPLNGDDSSNGVVRIFLKKEILNDLMPVMDTGGIQYILDSFGNILYCNSTEAILTDDLQKIIENDRDGDGKNADKEIHSVKIGGTDYMLLRENSSEDYTYLMLLPKNQLYQRRLTSILMVSVCILLAGVVGILLSFHMSARTVTPLSELLQQTSRVIEQKEGHQNAFERLSDTFRYLTGVNKEMTDQLEEQKAYIRNAFVYRILFENVISEKETGRTAEYMEIHQQGRKFCVLIFKMLLSEEIETEQLALLNTCLLSLMEMLEKEQPGSLYANTGENQVSLIMNMEAQEENALRQQMEKVVENVKRGLPGNIAERIFIYGGMIVDSLGEVHESYQTATIAFQNEMGEVESSIIWYRASEGQMPVFPSSEMAARLTKVMTAGDEQGLHDALKLVMTKYILDNRVSPYLQQLIVTELQSILLRIIGNLGLEKADYDKYYELLEKNQHNPVLAQITNTLNLYRDICSAINERNKNDDCQDLMPAIVGYIDANYGDGELSLAKVAGVFNISEPYLSSMFKQSMGINFSSYVGSVRIDKAKEMLKQTNMSVGDIALATGYYSANSFCRAFKRVTGLSTTEYRKS